MAARIGDELKAIAVDTALPDKPWPRVDPRVVLLAYALLLLLAIVSPRAAAAVLIVIGIMALVGHWLHGRPLQELLRFEALALALCAFAGWACVSALWSPVPASSAGKAALAVVLVLAASAAVAAVRTEDAALLRAAALGLVLAVLAGALFTVFETLSSQVLTRSLLTAFPSLRIGYEKHLRVVDDVVVWLSSTNINRRTTVVALLLWPAAFAAAAMLRGRLRTALLLALAAVAALLLAFTHHQSSQAALLAGLAVLGLSASRPAVVSHVLAIAWCSALLLAVPLAAVAYRADLHQAAWLLHSARHRVVIWGYTAEQIAKAPLLGVGADATAHLDLERPVEAVEKTENRLYARTTGRHAHNVYLQIWYELGAIGVLLFLPLGLIAVRGIRRASRAAQPWAAALFAASAVMMAFSYGLWQAWFQAAFGVAVIMLVIVDTLQTRVAEG